MMKRKTPIIAYKGFNRKMICKGFQYEECKEYDMYDGTNGIHFDNGDIIPVKRVSLCSNGFHACMNPMDCFHYYRGFESSVYHKVELSGDIDTGYEFKKHSAFIPDSKVCASHIKILEEISIDEMMKISSEKIGLDIRNVGTISTEDDLNELVNKGFNIGNIISIPNNFDFEFLKEYNYETLDFMCIHNYSNNRYIFILLNTILSTINYNSNIVNPNDFEHTGLYTNIVVPIGQAVRNKFGKNIKIMNIASDNSNIRMVNRKTRYRTYSTLPTTRDFSTYTGLNYLYNAFFENDQENYIFNNSYCNILTRSYWINDYNNDISLFTIGATIKNIFYDSQELQYSCHPIICIGK